MAPYARPMEAALDAIAAADADPDGHVLVALVAAVRPARADDVEAASAHLAELCRLLDSRSDLRDRLKGYLERLFASSHQRSLYADVGMLPNAGFFTELWRRFSQKLLPPAIETGQLRDLLDVAFAHTDDHEWVAGVGVEPWLALCRILDLDFLDPAADSTTREELAESVVITSTRIGAMGTEPSLARVYPALRDYESPFVAQLVETLRHVEAYRLAYATGKPAPEVDEKQILVLLAQCRDIITRVRRNTAETGVSVGLTYLLQRLDEHIERLEALLDILDRAPDHDRAGAAVRLFQGAVRALNRKNDLSAHFAKNTELLAREVTEHSGRTGEHYVAADRAEWRRMFRAALGAGLIVPVMAFSKFGLHQVHAPPIVEGVLYSLNYVIGFVLIHVLHFTLATKQPAMTAARIALALDRRPGEKPDLEGMVELVVRVARTQFVAVVGNVILAFPVALLLCLAVTQISGSHPVDPEAARRMLDDVHPLRSLALFHAAIAGVYLFMSGLVAGYFDNLAVYHRVPERLARLPWLRRLLGPRASGHIGTYVENNLGGIAGNVFLGMALGMTAGVAVGFGLPLDIRHVTFSAANFAMAFEGMALDLPWQQIAFCVVGIGLIGLVNLVVSFALALLVALKARRIRFRYTGQLARGLARRLVATPLDFVRPPRGPAGAPDSSSH